jgi:UDP-galactopyranose mutase
MYELYRRDGELLKNVVFGARLGTYRYLDMDKVIDQALEMYETRIKRGSKK